MIIGLVYHNIVIPAKAGISIRISEAGVRAAGDPGFRRDDATTLLGLT